MYCNKCGTEIEEKEKFCSNCGKSVKECTEIGQEEGTHINNRKIKFKVSDVVNRENVLNSTNKVAYIANGWALRVRNRGIDLAVITVIIFFIVACISSSDIPYGSNESSEGVFLSTFGIGILYSIITVMVFNTVAFVIRMGAEIIQLLDDIKNKE